MKVVSSFIPPVNHQPRFNGEAGKANANQEIFAELVDDNLSVPVSAVVETEENLPQFGSQDRFLERVDLRSFRDEGLPLSNQRALESYQAVANSGNSIDASLARLDLIV